MKRIETVAIYSLVSVLILINAYCVIEALCRTDLGDALRLFQFAIYLDLLVLIVWKWLGWMAKGSK